MGTRDLAGERVARPLARVEQRNLPLRLAVAGPEQAARLGAVAELGRTGVEDAVQRLDERVDHEVARRERVDQVVRAALAAVADAGRRTRLEQAQRADVQAAV